MRRADPPHEAPIALHRFCQRDMTCSDFIHEFSEYLDGGQPSEDRAEAEAHLFQCVRCRRYLEVFGRGQRLLLDFAQVEVAADFHPRLEHRIYRAEELAALSGSSGSSATVATTLGMAVLVVVAAWSPLMVPREPLVDLAPIVVSRPAPRPLGLRPTGVTRFRNTIPSLGDESADFWSDPADLLFQYSPLAEAGRARLHRAGLD